MGNVTQAAGGTKLGVYHYMSRPHSQRYVDEVVFRWNQRTITSDYLSHSQLRERRVPKAFLEQLSVLFKRAIGCELRRARDGGITTPATNGRAVATTGPVEPIDWASLGCGGFELMPVANARPMSVHFRVSPGAEAVPFDGGRVVDCGFTPDRGGRD